MELLTAAGILGGGVATTFATLKVIIELSVLSKSKLREDYKFSKEFFKEIDENTPMRHLVQERGYHAIAGSSSIPLSDIIYICSLEKANEYFKDYSICLPYLAFSQTTNKIDFKKAFTSKGIRITWKIGSFLLYTFFGSLAIAPLIFGGHYGLPESYRYFSILTLPTCGLFAAASLISMFRLGTSERLVKEQAVHTP